MYVPEGIYHYVYAYAQTMYSHSGLCIFMSVRMLRYNFVFLPTALTVGYITLILTVLGIPCAILIYCINKKTRRRTRTGIDMSYLKGLSYSHTIVAYPANYDTYCSVNHQGMVPEFSYA